MEKKKWVWGGERVKKDDGRYRCQSRVGKSQTGTVLLLLLYTWRARQMAAAGPPPRRTLLAAVEGSTGLALPLGPLGREAAEEALLPLE